MAKTIHWGIIGCGNVCEVKSGPGFRKASNSALVAVMRRDGDAAEDFARRHEVARWYTNAEELIADQRVDAVYIATPPGNHLEYTRMAAAAGKAVYVEKPMARTYAECLEMIALCQRAKVPLFVAYYRRKLPRFLAIRELVNEGGIGKPLTVRVAYARPVKAYERSGAQLWRVQPDRSGGGYLWDIGSHALDFLDYLFGPVLHASGYATNNAGRYAVEDTVAGAFTFANGVTGTGLWCFCAGQNEDCMEIIGSEGSLRFSVFGTEPPSHTRNGKTMHLPGQTPEHIQQPLIQSIVDELNGEGTCPSIGESAARTNRVMQQLTASMQPFGPS